METQIAQPTRSQSQVDISRALQIEGWTSEDELRWLAEQAQSLPRTSRIVEIGVFKGRSARAILDSLPYESTLYGVDRHEPYSDEGVRDFLGEHSWDQVSEEMKHNLADKILSREFVYFRESSARAALRFHDHTIDMIFIDGDHNYRSVLNDITAWERAVKPGGLICGHDYNVHPDVKLAVDECFSYGRIKFPAGSIWAVRKPQQ